jgi:hypothetical protein
MIEKISDWDIENVFYLIGFIIFLFLFFTSTILPKLRDDAKADLEKENGNIKGCIQILGYVFVGWFVYFILSNM